MHISQVSCITSKVITSSDAENGAKRVRNGPVNYPKVKVGKYGKRLYHLIEQLKRDKKRIETYA